MKQFYDNLNGKLSVKAIAVYIALLASVNFSLIIRGEHRRDNTVIELKKTSQLSRLMLNARAQVQIILINASLEDRRLNPTEIDRIKQNWHQAEYDLIPEEK